jgi:hypothetical protein
MPAMQYANAVNNPPAAIFRNGVNFTTLFSTKKK